VEKTKLHRKNAKTSDSKASLYHTDLLSFQKRCQGMEHLCKRIRKDGRAWLKELREGIGNERKFEIETEVSEAYRL